MQEYTKGVFKYHIRESGITQNNWKTLSCHVQVASGLAGLLSPFCDSAQVYARIFGSLRSSLLTGLARASGFDSLWW